MTITTNSLFHSTNQFLDHLDYNYDTIRILEKTNITDDLTRDAFFSYSAEHGVTISFEYNGITATPEKVEDAVLSSPHIQAFLRDHPDSYTSVDHKTYSRHKAIITVNRVIHDLETKDLLIDILSDFRNIDFAMEEIEQQCSIS